MNKLKTLQGLLVELDNAMCRYYEVMHLLTPQCCGLIESRARKTEKYISKQWIEGASREIRFIHRSMDKIHPMEEVGIAIEPAYGCGWGKSPNGCFRYDENEDSDSERRESQGLSYKRCHDNWVHRTYSNMAYIREKNKENEKTA